MIKTKSQGIIFGIIMSYAMAYGMEVYNMAIKLGFDLQVGGFSTMTNIVFWEAFKEALYMGLFVFLFSNLWGNRFGAAFAARHSDPERDNPYFCRLLRQGGAEKPQEQALLEAMRPYLSEKRRSKMDKAMKIARLAQIARLAMGEMGGDGGD